MPENQSTLNKQNLIPLPKKHFTTEFFVGVFTLMGVLCAGYLSVGLGGLNLKNDQYQIYAEFDNVSGLKYGASVEIGGVPIGEVAEISLKDPAAKVTLNIKKNVQIKDDDIASIRTKGIIGDRYVKISRGASDQHVNPGGTLTETESVVDLEDVIGKLVHSFTGDKDKDSEQKDTEKDKESKGK